MFKRIIDFVLRPLNSYLEHRKFKQRLKELRERDPFIYK
jgi:hypothetical protein